MKNYYYNQKTQDLIVYDTERNEVLAMERITGIHVFTSSELKDPARAAAQAPRTAFSVPPSSESRTWREDSIFSICSPA
jgi:hypothetical protein